MIRSGTLSDIKSLPMPVWLRQYAPALLATLLTFGSYLLTMAPGAFPLDSAELSAGAARLGLVHAPGYSVYLLLGHLFTRLPVGDVAYRMNLFSAVATSATVGLLVILISQMTRRTLPALVAGLSYGFCFYTWSLSVVAEVYALQSLFLVTMLLAIWQWRRQGAIGALLTAAFFLGLAAANNPSTLLWWPGLLLLAWSTPNRDRLSWPGRAKVAGLFVLGLLFVLYIPIRSAANPDFNYIGQYDSAGVFQPVNLRRLDNLIWYLSGRQFDWAILAYSAGDLVKEVGRLIYWLWAAFLGVGLPLGIWGSWKLWTSRRSVAVGLLLIALLQAVFFVAYRVPDKETMFLPVYLIWAIFLGIGLDRLRWHLPNGWLIIAALLPLALLIINLPYADVSDLISTGEVAQDRLQQAEPDTLYLAAWGDSAVMEYVQIAEGRRPDVQVVNILLARPAVRREMVSQALEAGRSVQSSFVDPALKGRFLFIPVEHGFIIEFEEKEK